MDNLWVHISVLICACCVLFANVYQFIRAENEYHDRKNKKDGGDK